MTNLQSNAWSETLQEQTRDAIAQMPVTPDGRLHFKHTTLGYAYATLDDLMNERMLLQAKTNAKSYWFGGVEVLLQAGWALD
jgi:hypothetical protein